MTKRTRDDGKEVVELGYAEKVIFALAGIIVVSLLVWIGTTVQDLSVRVAKLEVRADNTDRRTSGVP